MYGNNIIAQEEIATRFYRTETVFELLSKLKKNPQHFIFWPMPAYSAALILVSTKFFGVSKLEAITILTTLI